MLGKRTYRYKFKHNLFNKTKPQSRSSRCHKCGVSFFKKPLCILFKDCCECVHCGAFMIMEEGFIVGIPIQEIYENRKL